MGIDTREKERRRTKSHFCGKSFLLGDWNKIGSDEMVRQWWCGESRDCSNQVSPTKGRASESLGG